MLNKIFISVNNRCLQHTTKHTSIPFRRIQTRYWRHDCTSMCIPYRYLHQPHAIQQHHQQRTLHTKHCHRKTTFSHHRRMCRRYLQQPESKWLFKVVFDIEMLCISIDGEPLSIGVLGVIDRCVSIRDWCVGDQIII